MGGELGRRWQCNKDETGQREGDSDIVRYNVECGKSESENKRVKAIAKSEVP